MYCQTKGAGYRRHKDALREDSCNTHVLLKHLKQSNESTNKSPVKKLPRIKVWLIYKLIKLCLCTQFYTFILYIDY